MIGRHTNESDDPLVLLPALSKRLEGIRSLRNELDEDLMMAELSLNEFIGSLDAVGLRLKRIQAQPKKAVESSPLPVASAPAAPGGMTLDEFKTHMGSMLEGSLDKVSNKLSDKIQAMLKELGTLSGPAREVRIREYQESGEYASVDFSSLYKDQKVQSNLGEVGVEEKETKSIDANLERLRKLRALKGKPEDKKT
ncbi:MAG: hypothetical protein HQL21_08355 [Candidatus Omnitrophica bacterium]|nr:hypothetical protein [Candidatus Omnitrophota bacterium]